MGAFWVSGPPSNKMAPNMTLTDTAIRNAKPAERDYKLADSGGLFVLVTPAGGKLRRLKFPIDGKEHKLSLGRYPDVSLSEARKRTRCVPCANCAGR